MCSPVGYPWLPSWTLLWLSPPLEPVAEPRGDRVRAHRMVAERSGHHYQRVMYALLHHSDCKLSVGPSCAACPCLPSFLFHAMGHSMLTWHDRVASMHGQCILPAIVRCTDAVMYAACPSHVIVIPLRLSVGSSCAARPSQISCLLHVMGHSMLTWPAAPCSMSWSMLPAIVRRAEATCPSHVAWPMCCISLPSCSLFPFPLYACCL